MKKNKIKILTNKNRSIEVEAEIYKGFAINHDVEVNCLNVTMLNGNGAGKALVYCDTKKECKKIIDLIADKFGNDFSTEFAEKHKDEFNKIFETVFKRRCI